MSLTLHQPTPAEALSPSLKPGTKLGVTDLATLWQCLAADPPCPSRVVFDKLAPHQLRVSVSVRYLN